MYVFASSSSEVQTRTFRVHVRSFRDSMINVLNLPWVLNVAGKSRVNIRRF